MLSYGDGVGEGYVGCGGERGSGDGCAGTYPPRETPPLLALRRLMQEMVAVREAMFSINGKVEKMHQLVTLVALGLRVHKQRVQRLETKLKGVEWTLMSCGAVKDTGKSKSKAKDRDRDKDRDKARRHRDANDKRERERQRGVAEAAVQATGTRASRARAWSWAHAPHTRSLSSTRAPTTTTTVATTTPTGSSTPERAAGAGRPRPCSSRSWDSRPASGAESRWRLRPRWQQSPGAARREQTGGRAALGRRLLKEVEDGNVQGVLQLLDLGADANFSSARRWVPLHRAARKANADVLSMLLLWGANVHARTSYGFTALHIAAYNDPSGRCVAVLLEAGSDVHSRNKSGRTPLHSAAECGNEAAVRALLAAGARATEQDDGGRTPYDAAKTEAVRRLLAPD